jgi:DNA-binding CsgD family transcriptional regulator
MLKRLFPFQTSVFVLAISLAFLLLILRWLDYHFIYVQNQLEFYSVAIAIFFTGIGTWLMKLWIGKFEIKTEIENKAEPVSINVAGDLGAFDLTAREVQVLQLIAKGCSNQEIADQLFVSLNTVKTHISKILSKLDVKRRTQAVEKARRLGFVY